MYRYQQIVVQIMVMNDCKLSYTTTSYLVKRLINNTLKKNTICINLYKEQLFLAFVKCKSMQFCILWCGDSN